MKKLITMCIALIVMSSCVYADEVKIYTDNSVINYMIDGHYPYIDEVGNTLVPLERTLEAYGVAVEWNSEKDTAKVIMNDHIIQIPMGQTYIQKNEERISTTVASTYFNGKAYMPVRPIIEALDGEVIWDTQIGAVRLSFKASVEQQVYELMTLNFDNLYSLSDSKKLFEGHWKTVSYAMFTEYKETSSQLNTLASMRSNGGYLTYSNYNTYEDGTGRGYASTDKTENHVIRTESGDNFFYAADVLVNTYQLKLLDQKTYKYIPSEKHIDLNNKDLSGLGEYIFIDEDTFATKFVVEDVPVEIYDDGIEKMTIVMIDKRVKEESEKFSDILSKKDDIIRIRDHRLETVIRETINKPYGLLFKEDVTGIVELDASRINITDLEGIQHLENLTILNLDNDYYENGNAYRLNAYSINDLTPLKDLKNLKELYLNNNAIEDIEPLKNLKNLKVLHLGNNRIADISPLKDLTNLEVLWLSLNRISDITTLKNLERVTELSLFENHITDIKPLSALNNLYALAIFDNDIYDYTPLSGLNKLKILYLDGNPAYDLTPLKGIYDQLEEKDFELRSY